MENLTNSDIIHNINSKTLETDPHSYLLILNEAISRNMIVSHIINNTDEYRTWYSPTIQQLFYLTGDLKNEKSNSGFYGCNSSIDQDTAISILKQLMILGADPHVKNYYKENMYDILDELDLGKLTTRVNNERFIEVLKIMIKY